MGNCSGACCCLNCADDLISFWHFLVCHTIVNVNCIMFTFVSPGPTHEAQELDVTKICYL
jgi:hypothetical protein